MAQVSLSMENVDIDQPLSTEAHPAGIPLFMTVANSAKTIMGAGILTLPWAFHYSSLWPGLFFTSVMCMLSAYGYYLVGACSEITGMRTYGEIWKAAFGDDVAWLPNLATFGLTFLATTAFLIICGDYVPHALQDLGCHWAPLQNRRIVTSLMWALILPLSFLRDLSFLGYTSILGTLGCLYCCGIVFSEAVQSRDDLADWKPFEFGAGVFLFLPTVTFSLNGHFNVPDIYQQLERRSPARWMLVTTCAYGLIFLLTCVIGIAGYLRFGSALALPGRSNVLAQPDLKGRPEVMLAYIATSFAVLLSIPLYMQSCRDALDLLWLRFRPAATAGNTFRRHALMLFCCTSTLATSMVLTDLGLVSAIGGALCSCCLMFIFPPLMYIKCKSGSVRDVGDHFTVFQIGLLRLTIVIGVIVTIAGIITSILSMSDVEIKGG